jgi:hypothetical protein
MNHGRLGANIRRRRRRRKEGRKEAIDAIGVMGKAWRRRQK